MDCCCWWGHATLKSACVRVHKGEYIMYMHSTIRSSNCLSVIISENFDGKSLSSFLFSAPFRAVQSHDPRHHRPILEGYSATSDHPLQLVDWIDTSHLFSDIPPIHVTDQITDNIVHNIRCNCQVGYWEVVSGSSQGVCGKSSAGSSGGKVSAAFFFLLIQVYTLVNSCEKLQWLISQLTIIVITSYLQTPCTRDTCM